MKIGDTIEIEGQGKQEIYIREVINGVYILGLKEVPEKSGLEKACEQRASCAPPGEYKIGLSEGIWYGARALLKYAEDIPQDGADVWVSTDDLRKWCGK